MSWPPAPASRPPEMDSNTEAMVTSIVTYLDARENAKAADSATLAKAADRAKNLKAIAGAILFFGSIFAGAVLTFQELQDKPTLEDVLKVTETKVAPVREKATEVEAVVSDVAGDVDEIKEDLDRVEQVQEYSLEQSAWQGDVLLHVAERKRTKPPAKPESLKKKERELLRQ